MDVSRIINYVVKLTNQLANYRTLQLGPVAIIVGREAERLISSSKVETGLSMSAQCHKSHLVGF